QPLPLTPSPHAERGKRRYKVLCGFMLALMGVNLLSNAALRSLTNDELVHIPSGHRYLVERNVTLNPEHPPLAKIWSALPLALLRVRFYRTVERDNLDFAVFTTSYSGKFWELNRHRWWQITFWSRLPMVVLTIALGVLIFVYAKGFFNARAATFSVALFILEPTMLAHGWIVHTDMAAAFASLLFLLMLQRYWLQPTVARAAWLGVVTGVALLTKFSLIIVTPIFLGALVYCSLKRGVVQRSKLQRALAPVLAVLSAFVVVNAGYFFRHPRLQPQDSNWLLAHAGTVGNGWILSLFSPLSKLIPTYYLFGVFTVFVHNQQGHQTSLLGSYGSSGWWYYFPVAFALKTSLPFLVLTVASVGWAVWVSVAKRERSLIPVLLAVALYLAIAMTSRINIGIRHILPLFPFLFILGGVCLDRFVSTRRIRAKALLVAILFGSMIFQAARTYPHYVSFTNQLTLGRSNWQVLSDSNVEWGQDIGALARYLHERGETTVSAALSAGWMTPQLHSLNVSAYPPPDMQSARTRYVAIGASYLNGSTVPGDLHNDQGEQLTEDQRVNYFARYRTLTPERVFGNSIYLFRKSD
ncbi:MAG: glycosyltransferase family 39 protein, partial [Pyrinomonadaceae bacterium]